MRDRFFDIFFLGQRMLGECNSFVGGGDSFEHATKTQDTDTMIAIER